MATSNHGRRCLTHCDTGKYATMLRWEKNTRDRSGIINPNHPEWVMGFPNDSTKLDLHLELICGKSKKLLYARSVKKQKFARAARDPPDPTCII